MLGTVNQFLKKDSIFNNGFNMQIGDYVMRKIDLVFWQFKSRSKHPSSVQSSDYEIIFFRQKNKEQRENVIGELVTTEREYCRDLKLTWQAFSLDDPDVLEQKQIDVKGKDFEKEKSVKSRLKIMSCNKLY